MNIFPHLRPDGSECPYQADAFCNKCGWAKPASYDRMIRRTQDGPDPLVPEPGPGKGK